MVFNSAFVGVALLVAVLLWQLVITWWLKKTLDHYNRLSGGLTKTGLTGILEQILEEHLSFKKRLSDQEKALRWLLEEGKLHLQKVGIVRFNPFSDTGGSQSFTLALLDGAENGIILTSLYGRAGSRWYLKPVKAGVGIGIDLAKEEQAAIKNAVPMATLRLK